MSLEPLLINTDEIKVISFTDGTAEKLTLRHFFCEGTVLYCTVSGQKKVPPWLFFGSASVNLIMLICSVLINNGSNDMKFCRNNDLKV